MDTMELAAALTVYLETKDIVVIPAIFKSRPKELFFILPASEGTIKDFAGALSRAKIIDYRAVGYVEYTSENFQPHLDALMKTFPEGYTIMALEIKDIKVRNIPKAQTDD